MSRGSKPGERRGGRQKGTPNKRKDVETQAIQTYITGQVLEAQRAEYDPVEAIQAITKWAEGKWRSALDASNEKDALTWAALVNEWGKQAAPYIRPRLNAVEARVNVSITIFERIERANQRLAA